MLEAAEMVAAVLIFLSGLGVGRVQRRKRFKEPKPQCGGCKHHYSFHPEGGACVYQHLDWYWGFDDEGRQIKKFKTCACQQYSGPIPLDSYTASS